MEPEAVAIIPARNEEATIQQVVQDLRRSLEHVVLVDDASEDATAELARAAGATVVSHSSNRGYGPSVCSGIASVRTQPSCFVTIDADGAHAPADLPGLLRAHRAQGNDLTIGNRFARGADLLPSTKRWANLFATRLVNLVLRTSLQDVACGFRVYSGSLAYALRDLALSSGFRLAYDSIWLALQHRGRIGSEPVSVVYDATEFLSTQRGELLDLLEFARERSASQLAQAVLAMRDLVRCSYPFTVMFGDDTLCLHPVDNPDSYVFQRQPPALRSKCVGDVIRLQEE